ncbi:hypothetical protein [Methylobacterium sp. sgz302541]|uniref:hypothetical protein n=1 Tax=unclassified Methylobacterium TaxID=2615210 RepID=UPI003D34CE49
MSSFFGSDGSFVLQFAVIFVVILAVLTAGVLLVRRFGGGGGLSAKPGQRARQPRLGIVDVYELDRQRQLILLRRDNVEHLLLVGGPNDVVIERNIQRGQRLPETVLREERAPEPAPEIEARRPEPQLFEEVPPTFEMPAVVAAPVPGSILPPPSRHPLTEADLPPEPRDGREPEPPVQEAPAPVSPPPPAPAPEPRGRFLRRSTPPLVNPKPDVASERVRSEPTFTIATPLSAEADPAPPVPPPVTPPIQRAVDAAILSDMARQLEIALARPASAVTPPPGAAKPVPAPVEPPAPQPAPPEPPAQVPAQAVDPVAAAMSGPPQDLLPHDLPAQEDAAEALFEEIVPVEEISPPPVAAHPVPQPVVPEPSPAQAETEAPAAQDEVAESPPAPARDEPADRASPPAESAHPVAAEPKEARTEALKPKPAPNPFSVEEIEAEFARLLGRPLDKRN